jgi:hypothetical protein
VRTGIIAVAVIVVIAVALFGVLEALPLPVSCTTAGTVLVDQTTSVSSTLTTTTEAQIEHAINQTDRVFNFNPSVIFQPTLTTIPNIYISSPMIIITPNQYVYQDVRLAAGMDVQVWWIGNNTLDAYVLNSSENAAYAESNATMTSPNIASSHATSQSGSLSFHVSVDDVYFLAFFNPHNGSRGLGSHTVGLFNATGMATFKVTTTTLVTQTTSTVVFVPQQVTSTQTTTSSYRRTANLLSQIGGTACFS